MGSIMLQGRDLSAKLLPAILAAAEQSGDASRFWADLLVHLAGGAALQIGHELTIAILESFIDVADDHRKHKGSH